MRVKTGECRFPFSMSPAPPPIKRFTWIRCSTYSSRSATDQIDWLDFSKLPIVVFTNRLEDGIMHGATIARRMHSAKRWSRPIKNIAIRRS